MLSLSQYLCHFLEIQSSGVTLMPLCSPLWCLVPSPSNTAKCHEHTDICWRGGSLLKSVQAFTFHPEQTFSDADSGFQGIFYRRSRFQANDCNLSKIMCYLASAADVLAGSKGKQCRSRWGRLDSGFLMGFLLLLLSPLFVHTGNIKNSGNCPFWLHVP